MTQMNDMDDYVRAAAQLHGITLSDEQFQRIALNFRITASVVAPLLAFPIPIATDPAPTFKA